jgi:hypothetical protein
MTSSKECRSLLNIKLIQGEIFGCDPLWSNNVAQFKPSMHSRLGVICWLTRILLHYSFPPTQDPLNPVRENFTPNVSAVFKSIDFLIYLGYPRHWFKVFLQDVLNNNLVTVERFPTRIPSQHRLGQFDTQVDLTHVLMELNLVATMYAPALGLGEIIILLTE